MAVFWAVFAPLGPFGAFLGPFGVFLGPFGPSLALCLVVSSAAAYWSKMTSRSPKWSENAPKTPKMGPNGPAYRGPKGPLRAYFWAYFGSILGRFCPLGPFGPFGGLLGLFGALLGPFGPSLALCLVVSSPWWQTLEFEAISWTPWGVGDPYGIFGGDPFAPKVPRNCTHPWP